MLDDTGGVLDTATFNGPFTLANSATLRGGTVVASPARPFIVNTGDPFFPIPPTLDGITLNSGSAGLALDNGGLIIHNGLTLLNSTVGSGTAPARLSFNGSGAQSFGGTGDVNLGDFGQGSLTGNSDVISIAAGIVVHGFGGTMSGNFLNQGTIDIGGGTLSTHGISQFTNAGRVSIAAGGTYDLVNANFVNASSGTVVLGPGAALLLRAGTFANAGTVTLGAAPTLVLTAGETFSNTGSFTLGAGGTARIDGTLSSTQQILLSGFSLAGTGRINADVHFSGSLNPGSSTATTLIGTLTFQGALALLDGAHYAPDLDINTGGHDTLAVLGDLDLSGNQDFLDLPAFVNPGQSFLVATYTGALSGTFDNVTPDYSVSYATPGQITVTGIPEPASPLAVLGAGGLSVLLRRRRARRSRTQHQADRGHEGGS